MDVKEEAILGPAIRDHWYYVSKGRALLDFLGTQQVAQLLDVGAGSGIFTRQLIDAGLAGQGLCVDPAYEQAARHEVHNGRTIAFVREAGDEKAELILMMDVLEHVEDDLGLLKAYASNLAPGGRVLITVPAFQFLWSGHDVFLEHRRRYTLGEIEQVVRSAGLRVLKGRYFFGALFPLVSLMRTIDRLRLRTGKTEAKSQLKPASPYVNEALVRLHDVERRSLFGVNRLAGLTAFCLAQS